MSYLANEYRAWERTCLEQAELCKLPEARDAYRSLADNYRAARIRTAADSSA